MTLTSPPNSEAFVPPANLPPPSSGMGRLLYHLKCFADLQVASLIPPLRAWLASRRGEILEVGCGAQPYRHFLAQGCRYQGLDWQSSQEVFGYRAPDTVYYKGGEFPFADQSFDHLFCNEVLEHIYQVHDFLAQCHRVLRRGGEIFLSVPFQARYHYIPHDYWRFTPAALERLLSKAGFTQIQVVNRGCDLTVAAYKGLSLVYRWLAGGLFSKLWGLCCVPLGVAALLIGQASLRFNLGSPDDPLGYWVVARRP